MGILDALEFRALPPDLAAALGCDRRKVFKRGGAKELKDHGLVRTHPRAGSHRPDRPPPGLAEGGGDAP